MKIKEKMMANKLYKPLLIDSIKAAENIVQQRFIGFDGKYCKSGAKAFGVLHGQEYHGTTKLYY